MSTFVCILIFAAVGLLIGFLGSRLFGGTSLLLNLLLGLVGSFGVSWVASLLKVGAGFMTFSWWGLVMGILGACLTVGVYGLIVRHQESREHQAAHY